MPAQHRTCDRGITRPALTGGIAPFLLALVLAVPLLTGAGTVTLGAAATAGDSTSDVAGTFPAAVPPAATAPSAPSPSPVAPDAPVTDAAATPVSPPATTPPIGAAPSTAFIGPVPASAAPTDTTDSAAPASAAPAASVAATVAAGPTATAAVANAHPMIWKRAAGARPAIASAGTSSVMRNSPAVAAANAVTNPAGSAGTAGWQADSAAGPVSLTPVSGVSGPFAETTGLQFTRAGGTGDWARALADINDPATFFTVGHSYTMSAWVRDLNASGKSVGLLVADGAYQNRPSDMSIYEGHTDTAWHLLSRTFTAAQHASAQTGVYLALPESGPLSIQVTGVAVREVTVAGPATVTVSPTRTLMFDGAAGAAPDPATWNAETGGGGWGNGELQTYTDRTSNAHLDGAGNLVITARREDYAADDGILRHYTSARLTTENKMVIQPGSYVEASITAPVGKSVWPAFWLIGANVRQVGWPASGELDVLEGAGAQPTKAFNAAHMAKLGDPSTDMQYGWGEGGGTVDVGESLDSASHLYGVYFDGSTVRFYIDRREVRSLHADQAAASGRAWPFGKPQYVVLNVAVDGDSGDPVSTSFPRSMTVGGISVWQGGVPF